ncbi:MAG: DUF1269 domain-containing protein [Methylocystis sp.]
MRDLIVVGYPDAEAAERARDALLTLPREQIYRISEIVVASRDEKGAIKLGHLVHSSALSLATGTTSGLLIGLLFLHPVFGIVAGAAAGAAREGLSAVGLSKEFIEEVDGVLAPGQAAVVLQRDVSRGRDVEDHVVATLAASGGRLLKTTLEASIDHHLRDAFEAARRHARAEPESSGR